MPQIQKLIINTEKKIDLTSFFGEDAYLTIKRMNKYSFTFLNNKNREGYHAQIFERTLEMISQRPDFNPEQKMSEIMISPEEHKSIRDSFSPDDARDRIKIEEEVNTEFCKQSIKLDGHNFTDESGDIISLDGGSFYLIYGDLKNPEGVTLGDFLIRNIIQFNYEDVKLGEQMPER